MLRRLERLLAPEPPDIQARVMTYLSSKYGTVRRAGLPTIPTAAKAPDGGHWYGYRDRRRKALQRDPALCLALRERDGNRCRYCQAAVVWDGSNRPESGTFDHVEATGPNTMANVVVACRRCNLSRVGQRNGLVMSADSPRTDCPVVSAEMSAEGPDIGGGLGGAPVVASDPVSTAGTTRKTSVNAGKAEAKQLLTYLNAECKLAFRTVETNLVLIENVLKTGVNSNEIRAVIDMKKREWFGTEHAKWLRPSTLFRPRNFEQYLGQVRAGFTGASPAASAYQAMIEEGPPR